MIRINISFNNNENFGGKIITSSKRNLNHNNINVIKNNNMNNNKIIKTNLQDIIEFDTENNTRETYVNSPKNIYKEEECAGASEVCPAYLTSDFRPEQGFDFKFKGENENKTMNFNSFTQSTNSFLSQRRTISFNVNNNPNGKIYLSQKHKLRRNNLTFTYESFKKKFMTPCEDKVYPKAFLPEPGFGLMKNPFPIISEKRQKKSGV